MKRPIVAGLILLTSLCLGAGAWAFRGVSTPRPLTSVRPRVNFAETSASIRTARLGRGIVLRQFNFAFKEAGNLQKAADHKIRRLGFMPSSERVDVQFRDGDGRDPFNFYANYSRLQTRALQGVRRQQTARRRGCRGTCYVPIRSRPRGMRFILQGFNFSRRGGDANIREIAVRPEPERGRVKVTFRDNGAPVFDVELRYVYMVQSYVQRVGTVQGSWSDKRTLRQGFARLPAPRGVHAIQGFQFRFDNGDHHLASMGLEDLSDHFLVMFRDHNTDDPFSVSIDYALLNMRTIAAWR